VPLEVPAFLSSPGTPKEWTGRVTIFGTHDERTIIQFQDARSRAVDAALMADGHVGYVMPIGGVAA